MACAITFTDTTGAVTISPLGGRLNNWTPESMPVGDFTHRLGSGQRDGYVFRASSRVTFSFLLANSDMAKLERLRYWLLSGGTISVDTGDGSHSFTDLGLQESAEPRIVRLERETLDYETTLPLEYVGASTPPAMLCVY